MIEGIRVGLVGEMGGHPADLIAERFEQDRQQTVQLETKAAPVALDDFLVNGRDVEGESLIERADLEVLEGHGVEVRPLDRRERLGSRRQRPAEPNPLQVSLDLVVREPGHRDVLPQSRLGA